MAERLQMPKHARDLPFPALAIDPAASRPLHRQIYFAIREAILEGRLRPGARLPATRALAARSLRLAQHRDGGVRAAARRGLHRRPGRRRLVHPDHLPDEAPPGARGRRAAAGARGRGRPHLGARRHAGGRSGIAARGRGRSRPACRSSSSSRSTTGRGCSRAAGGGRSAPSWSAASPAGYRPCARRSPTISRWRARCSAAPTR